MHGEKWTAWRDERSGRFYFHSEAACYTQWLDPRLLNQTVSLQAASSSGISSLHSSIYLCALNAAFLYAMVYEAYAGHPFLTLECYQPTRVSTGDAACADLGD